MPISDTLRRIYAAAPGDIHYVEAISISHPGLNGDLHLTNRALNFEGTIENGAVVTFYSMPFSVGLPNKDTTGNLEMKLVFSNVQQELMKEIENMAAQPYAAAVIKYRLYVNTDFTVQQLDPPITLDIGQFQITRPYITAIATRVNLHNKPFPSYLYNTKYFPGLDR